MARREAQHIVNISGGKDSAACYLLAIERGRPFRAVTADTGHEAPETYEWIQRLAKRTGGPEVETVRADFSARMATKRETIRTKWPADGVPAEQVAQALDLFHPTGVPFLDMCMLKGRFPSSQTRFCTEHLKLTPIHARVYGPALDFGPVISWLGERRAESAARAKLPKATRVHGHASPWAIWRPILEWSATDVFDLHKRHGLPPNPLYLAGMGRVGCFPCIMARKGELASIVRRYPEAFEKLREWERLVSAVSKRGQATFFAADKTPEGARLAENGDADTIYPDALQVAEWSKTSRGGKQYDLLGEMDAGAACTSQYGLCE